MFCKLYIGRISIVCFMVSLFFITSISNAQHQSVQEQMKEAKATYYSGRKDPAMYEVPIEIYNGLIQKSPSIEERIEIYIYLAACYFRTGREDSAIESIRNLLELEYSHRMERDNIYRGDVIDFFREEFGDYFKEDYIIFFINAVKKLRGSIYVETTPPGATVYIDDVQRYGESTNGQKKNVTPMTIQNVLVGERTVRVNISGVPPQIRRVLLSPRATARIRFDLTPPPVVAGELSQRGRYAGGGAGARDRP